MKKNLSLPPASPGVALRIEIRDGEAHYICANGVPEQDASTLVQWARDLIDVWEEQQHTCNNCQKGTNYGTDGVYCNVKHDWMYGIYGGSDAFGKDCNHFTPEQDEEADCWTIWTDIRRSRKTSGIFWQAGKSPPARNARRRTNNQTNEGERR